MIKKHIDVMTYSITSGILLLFGGCLIWKREAMLELLLWIFGVIVLIQGLSLFVKKFRQKNFRNADTFRILCDMMLAFIFIAVPQLPMSILTILFALHLFLNGIAKGINALLYWKQHVSGVFTNCTACIFYVVFAIILWMAPYMKVEDVLLWIGIYCIALGVTYIRDIISLDRKLLLKRKIRITLPVWICALVPKTMLNKINVYLQDHQDTSLLSERKSEAEADMMVYIHATEKGFGMIGHIDFSIDHKVYSYGNYDHESVKMMEAFGDGVMFIAQEEPYLPFCILHEENTIFAFGLKLNKLQKQRVYDAIQETMQDAVSWKPNIVMNPQGKHPQFANQLYLSTKAEFYKFSKGVYQTYFVFGSNCVKFADHILGSFGSDILSIRGFLSPGTYLDYLQREYKKQTGFVISQSIYPYIKEKKGRKRHAGN